MSNQPKNDKLTRPLPWATGVDRQVMPTSGEQTEGWREGFKIPAKKLNYNLANSANAVDLLLRRALGDTEIVAGAGITIKPSLTGIAYPLGLVWHNSAWVLFMYFEDDEDIQFYSSSDGVSWSTDGYYFNFYTVSVSPNSLVVLDDNTLCAAYCSISAGAVALQYGPDYTNLSTSNVGRSSTTKIHCIATDGTRIMVGDGDGYISTVADKTGTWTHVFADGGNKIESITYLAGSVWYAISFTGTILISSDNGTSWSTISTISGWWANCKKLTTVDSRLIASSVSLTTNTPEFKYSDNGGVSWIDSILDIENTLEVATVGGTLGGDLINLGGTSLACSVSAKTNGKLYLLVSTDSGETWTLGNNTGLLAVTSRPYTALAFNGHRSFLASMDLNLMGALNS